MEFSATSGIFGNQLIRALGNTLMHSLWQGVLLAIAGGLIISLTRKQTAAVRYNLLLAAMLLFTCGIVITFLWELQPMYGGQPVTYRNGANAMVNAAANTQTPLLVVHEEAKPALTDMLLTCFNRYCNTIVMIWFLIICIKSVKLVAGVYEVYQLRRIRISAVSKYWEDRIVQLSVQLKIKQAIGLAESGLAKVPMVIGHLKPLILMPVGFINALTVAEVEAILAHELAHIRRRDYLVNLLQSFMEIVFFFNPAVLWISQLLKAERENCCDDIALEHTNNKYGYIQALLSCQEYQPARGLGMAMAGSKSNLLDRVKRIVNNNNQSLNIMEKTLLAIGLVAAGICTVAFSSAKTEIKIYPNHQTTAQGQNRHVTVDPKIGDVFKTGTKTYSLSKTDTRISGPGANGKKIAGAQAARYRPQIDALPAQNKQAEKTEAISDTSRSKTYLYKPSEFNDGTTMKVMASKDGKKQTAYIFKRDGVLYQFFMKGTHATAMYVDREEKPVSQYQSKIDELIEEYDEIAPAPVAPIAPMKPIGPMQPLKPVAMIAPVAAMQPMHPAVAALAMAKPVPPMKPMPPMAMIAPMKPMAPLPPVKPDTMFTVITQSLIKQGIIKDKNDYDIDITNKYLSVDGVKQSEELHKQVLDKLKMKPGDKISWHYSNHN